MHHVIIGNSAAGIGALETLRKHDRVSPVTLISREDGPAYSRVLLPYYLRQRIGFRNLYIKDNSYYEKLNIKVRFKQEVSKILSKQGQVELANGDRVNYDNLLIATGSKPFMPPIKNLSGAGVSNLWTINDAQNIEGKLGPGKSALILGSGFISLMAAWAAVNRGVSVTVVELLPCIMPQVLDEHAAAIVQDKLAQYNVALKLGAVTEKIARNDDGTITVHLQNEPPFKKDLVIVGTGVRPSIGLLENNDAIETDKGILVNEYMQTNIENIYAAGDVAQGPTVFGEKHVLNPLWSTAVEQGKIAGANMAGEISRYNGSLNMNVVSFFGITVASMGRFNSNGSKSENIIITDKDGYLKIVTENGVPIGAITIGNANCVPILGFLRPHIRYRKNMENDLFKLSKEHKDMIMLHKLVKYIKGR